MMHTSAAESTAPVTGRAAPRRGRQPTRHHRCTSQKSAPSLLLMKLPLVSHQVAGPACQPHTGPFPSMAAPACSRSQRAPPEALCPGPPPPQTGLSADRTCRPPPGNRYTSIDVDKRVRHYAELFVQLLHLLASGAAELGGGFRLGSDRREEVVPCLGSMSDGILSVFEVLLCREWESKWRYARSTSSIDARMPQSDGAFRVAGRYAVRVQARSTQHATRKETPTGSACSVMSLRHGRGLDSSSHDT